jgi:transposase
VLSLPPTVRVFVGVEPIDMRGSFDALAGAVRRLALDPVDGHLYLFLNKRRRIAKALWFDGSGWCLLAKRLEAGSFQLPRFGEAQTQVQVDGATFTSILAGLDFTAARKGWYRRRDVRPDERGSTRSIGHDLVRVCATAKPSSKRAPTRRSERSGRATRSCSRRSRRSRTPSRS